jgi:endonuclease YncB( thermonuclease family)
MKGGGGGRRRYEKYTRPLTETGSIYGSSGGGASDNCAKLTFKTKIQKPKPGLNKVKEGDLLSVELYGKTTISVYNIDSEECGNIVSPNNNKLIECINKGNVYIAKALKNRGDVEVIIRK